MLTFASIVNIRHRYFLLRWHIKMLTAQSVKISWLHVVIKDEPRNQLRLVCSELSWVSALVDLSSVLRIVLLG